MIVYITIPNDNSYAILYSFREVKEIHVYAKLGWDSYLELETILQKIWLEHTTCINYKHYVFPGDRKNIFPGMAHPIY